MLMNHLFVTLVIVLVVHLPLVLSLLSQTQTRPSLAVSKLVKYRLGCSVGEGESSYEGSSLAVKGIVGGLTKLFNLASNKNAVQRTYLQNSVTPEQVYDGVLGDFKDGYLFSGRIQSEIYAEDCTFTDPTLSFTGLSTFERNLESLRPALDFFLKDNACILYSIEHDKTQRKLYTKWRMCGDVRFPWNPRIELQGNTVFSYSDTDTDSDSDSTRADTVTDNNTATEIGDGRVTSYYERWGISASKALLQLLTPCDDDSVREVCEQLKRKDPSIVNIHFASAGYRENM